MLSPVIVQSFLMYLKQNMKVLLICLISVLLIGISLLVSSKIDGKVSFRRAFKRRWNITHMQGSRRLGKLSVYTCITCVIILVCFLAIQQFGLRNFFDKYINLSYDNNVTTTNTTIYATLMTVLLALIALAVTAYVFLNDALSNRENYEQGVIHSLKLQMRRRLFVICILSGCCVVCCLLVDNLKLSGWRYLPFARYTTVLVSGLDIPLLIVFINTIVNYEKHLSELARSYVLLNQKQLIKMLKESTPTDIQARQETNQGQNEADNTVLTIIKQIGDLENLVMSVLGNHESEYRYQQGITNSLMLQSVLSKKLNDSIKLKKTSSVSKCGFLAKINTSYIFKAYSRLVEIRNCLWILQKYGSDISIIQEELQDVILNTQAQLLAFAFREERFINLNFNNVDFKTGDFSYSSLKQSALLNTSFSNATLQDCDFSESLLQNIDFKKADCTGAVFSGARIIYPLIDKETIFENAVFRNCELTLNSIDPETEKSLLLQGTEQFPLNFKGVSWQHANLLSGKLVGINFENAVFLDAILASSFLTSCNFKYADFTGAILASAIIDGSCCFQYTNCSNITGVSSVWGPQEPDVSDLDLFSARFLHANLAFSKMERCKFLGAYMNDITFINAIITNCCFVRALLTNADFSYVSIDKCDFTSALLSGALFIGEKSNVAVANEYTNTCTDLNGSVKCTKFNSAEMIGCNIRNQIFVNCCFNETVFDSSIIRDVTFINCHFDNAQFNDVLLFNVSLINCKGHLEKSATTGMRFGTSKDKRNWRKSFFRF